ncbi:hypothetical protein [Bacillus mycoides]|uniref:hypothetical protein n=1 Tax=Bacillus mycoides TaxID=1405 RepID=UPI0005353610|nr:hypothetical protein [Bacillus mycoides]
MKRRYNNSNKPKASNKQLQFSNKDAWKYESFYKYQPLFSYSKLMNFLSQLLNVNTCAKYISFKQIFSTYNL